jgi:hypothetical protein
MLFFDFAHIAEKDRGSSNQHIWTRRAPRRDMQTTHPHNFTMPAIPVTKPLSVCVLSL